MKMHINLCTIILLFVITITNSNLQKKSSMAETVPPSSSAPADVYIVYTEQPSDGADHESSHLRTLSSVVGSEEAAKESLIYVYKSAATGFSAKLTPEQVSQLEKQPGVLQVVVSKTVQLHPVGGGGAVNNMMV
ncbi:subtilisin-like protease SBT5.6 [Chenopodium quinoa]|nr:subtilisin-like protease SBT5.6 [Chenopodium quinoa]